MKKFEVLFESGESRTSGTHGVNYMLANIINEDEEEIELYAEVSIEGSPFELDYSNAETPNEVADIANKFDYEGFSAYSFPLLKKEIIKQAIENGIQPEELEFFES